MLPSGAAREHIVSQPRPYLAAVPPANYGHSRYRRRSVRTVSAPAISRLRVVWPSRTDVQSASAAYEPAPDHSPTEHTRR